MLHPRMLSENPDVSCLSCIFIICTYLSLRRIIWIVLIFYMALQPLYLKPYGRHLVLINASSSFLHSIALNRTFILFNCLQVLFYSEWRTTKILWPLSDGLWDRVSLKSQPTAMHWSHMLHGPIWAVCRAGDCLFPFISLGEYL